MASKSERSCFPLEQGEVKFDGPPLRRIPHVGAAETERWELVTTIAAGGGLAAQRIVTMGGYDLEGAKDQARQAAGIV